MKEQQQNIRNNEFFKFASNKRYLKIFVPGFAFKHDDNTLGKDKFVGREIQFRRLYTWLTSDSKSGSYLITGYRGMGKSLLVRRVIDSIAREPKAYKEVLFMLASVFLFAACYLFFSNCIILGGHYEFTFSNNLSCYLPVAISFIISCVLVGLLFASLIWTVLYFNYSKNKFPHHRLYHKEMISKFFLKRKDRRKRVFEYLSITINLGQEVLNERDVLSLIAQSIKEKYTSYVHNRQRRPVRTFLLYILVFVISFFCAKNIFIPIIKKAAFICFDNYSLWMKLLQDNHYIYHTLNVIIYASVLWLMITIARAIRKHVPKYAVPYNALERLNILCDRISSTISEEKGINKRFTTGYFSLPIYKNRKRSMPMANVREIEEELLSIINTINSTNCPIEYRAQFIIVFDELDKVTKASDNINFKKDENDEELPDFETSVKGFTDAMAYEERKQNVLRLLANMKLFIASVRAKCVFISGYELFDASLADLSDREFAVSSIFNGVLNVSSFLSPEREETDVSSMTEVYVATMLLPEDYLMKKTYQNAQENLLLKDEQPSLRWYNEYLMEEHILNNAELQTEKEIEERIEEIRYAVEFLRYFCVFLSHVSNGSPKKIATYFEKYIKINYDVIKQFDWKDEITVGIPSEKNVREQCVLLFDANAQRLINFIYYLASPIMNAITNEVSHYGDKLLVSSSFMLDHIFKYHGNGFSWRNLELMPELLNSNKNPELRDSMTSIVEFLLQVYITPISFGVFQYKFHKQISEEISSLSKISEEAAAIFNFTLNESETVKRYNTRLLWHYLNLSKTKGSRVNAYGDILERIHENLGDIYFSEEDYYRAIHEYRGALQYITDKITPKNALAYIKCCLKIGMSYEYRRTFENAYMVYCQIINNLVRFKWIEEGELGLDYTMRLTKDWRRKQPVMIDKNVFSNKKGLHTDESYRRQFLSGLWEDINEDQEINKPQYSLDCDKTISGLSAKYTPEKSDVFLRLTAFEDVKYIYQAIIAKLFVTEKMEVSGITQSSIDEAEAEFKVLHNATNVEEKFMIAADFFGKMAQILYYKNNYVITFPIENVSSILYIFDINVLQFLDDFCFKECQSNTSSDAITIKEEIYEFFRELKFKEWFDDKEKELKVFKDLYDENTNQNNNVTKYLDYLNDKIGKINKININLEEIKDRMQECFRRRSMLMKDGRRLPCNACKYVNRSMILMMEAIFTGLDDEKLEIDGKESKVFTLLRGTSHKYLRSLRQEQVKLLASLSEQMGDIMMSCASTFVKPDEDKHIQDHISLKVIELLNTLSERIVPETERQNLITKLIDEKKELSRLERAILYYWASCRYYEIATMNKEAIHCVERVVKVIENYLYALSLQFGFLGSNPACSEIIKKDVYNNDKVIVIRLIENLFKYAARIVGRQYDNYDMAEIHEYKWLFQLEHADDMDLTKLSVFPDLQSIFFSAVNCNVYCYRLQSGDDDSKQKFREYVSLVYSRVASPFHHEKTFKSEVEAFYLKVNLNSLVLFDVLGEDPIFKERKAYYDCEFDKDQQIGTQDYIKSIETDYHYLFFTQLLAYLESSIYEEARLDNRIFKIKHDIESKLDLLDYLVVDSMVCLSNILKVLPPHNHITTFSNHFIAKVYTMLWEWSRYYDLLHDLYIYYRFDKVNDEENKEKIIQMIARNAINDDEKNKLKDEMKKLVELMANNNIACKDEFGYRYSKLFINIRHDVDDSTIHHIYTKYSVEMAIKYYLAARGINSEGVEYKNLISNMFILDDDLKNDTCQSNLADERYMLNSGIIDFERKWLQFMYKDSNINKLEYYEKSRGNSLKKSLSTQLEDRFEDSLFINTEY